MRTHTHTLQYLFYGSAIAVQTLSTSLWSLTPLLNSVQVRFQAASVSRLYWLHILYIYWLVAWNIFYVSIYWEESSQRTNMFQRGWNHQPVYTVYIHMYIYSTQLYDVICPSPSGLKLRMGWPWSEINYRTYNAPRVRMPHTQTLNDSVPT